MSCDTLSKIDVSKKSSARKKIVIIGSGPTALGAAWRLHELQHSKLSPKCGKVEYDYTLIDRATNLSQVGGLASSVLDENGFVWDLGGHVIFSHYQYFNELIKSLMPDSEMNTLQRSAWARFKNKWVPYPFQNNLWRLDKADLEKCLAGLYDVQRHSAYEVQRQGEVNHSAKAPDSPKTFEDWLYLSFGKGLTELFMIPYNKKVWAYDPSLMNCSWMSERVATVDLAKVQDNILKQKDDVNWGPNSTFKFPKQGGTGEIWSRLFHRLPKQNIILGADVMSIDTSNKCVYYIDRFAENKSDADDSQEYNFIEYDVLISTMPLDQLCRMCNKTTQLSVQDVFKKYTLLELQRMQETRSGVFSLKCQYERVFDPLFYKLTYSSTHVIGLGFQGTVPDELAQKSWMYFWGQNVHFIERQSFPIIVRTMYHRTYMGHIGH